MQYLWIFSVTSLIFLTNMLGNSAFGSTPYGGELTIQSIPFYTDIFTPQESDFEDKYSARETVYEDKYNALNL